MKNLKKIFSLPKEALLLDAWLYIFKSMPALAIAYFVGKLIPLPYLDSISLFLGVMYNLEAVNRYAFQSVKDQLIASSLGGLATGLLILVSGYEVGVLTLALGMGITIYISILVNYRVVSGAALFTSIYMTQLLRLNALGQPDVFLTLAIRLGSLALGSMIALGVNVLFSVLYYRHLADKRLEFVKGSVLKTLKESRLILNQRVIVSGQSSILANAFSDIELVKANLEAIQNEKSKLLSKEANLNLNHQIQRIIALKNMAHLMYDILYRWESGESKPNRDVLEVLDKIIEGLAQIDFEHNVLPDVLELKLPNGLNGDFSRMAINIKWMALHYQELA